MHVMTFLSRKMTSKRRWCCSVPNCCSVGLFATPWTAAHQAPLSSTISWSLLKFMSLESVMLSNHLILCCRLLLPSIFPSIRALVAQLVKNPPANSWDVGSIPGLGGFPWRRKWQHTSVFLPEKSHGQRSLGGHNPWDHRRVGQNLVGLNKGWTLLSFFFLPSWQR